MKSINILFEEVKMKDFGTVEEQVKDAAKAEREEKQRTSQLQRHAELFTNHVNKQQT